MKRPYLHTLMALCVSAATASAQRSGAHVCYRFDQPYFSVIGSFPGGPVFSVATALLRLDADLLPAAASVGRDSQLHPVEPMPFHVDSSTQRRYLSSSGWEMIGPDSVRIVWKNELYGPVFRMRVRGDSLVGEYTTTSDAHPITPPPRAPRSANAVRFGC